MTETGAIAGAEEAGRNEAAAFDARLRELESREREARLIALAAEHPHAAGAAVTPALPGDLSTLEDLERQVQFLAEFRRAVLASKGWRAIETARRLLGRPQWR